MNHLNFNCPSVQVAVTDLQFTFHIQIYSYKSLQFIVETPRWPPSFSLPLLYDSMTVKYVLYSIETFRTKLFQF